MEKIQSRGLQFIYDDTDSTYEELLTKSKLPTLKIRRIRTTVLPQSIVPCFIANLAYLQNSRLCRFPPLKTPRYTARHKSRKTNLNSPVSTAHN